MATLLSQVTYITKSCNKKEETSLAASFSIFFIKKPFFKAKKKN
tara:strand:- start:1581 stop:1712 length:132 start_codon:yes stop_codon:yes gene_type:complete